MMLRLRLTSYPRAKTWTAKKVFVMGWSLGGAVAIALSHAQQSRICGLIVENTFSSLSDMVMVLAQKIYPFQRGKWFIRLFLGFYLSSPWLSKERAADLTVPILYISGLRDQLIPPAQMQALHDASESSVSRSMFTVPHGSHDNTFIKGGEAYFEAISQFMHKHSSHSSHNSSS